MLFTQMFIQNHYKTPNLLIHEIMITEGSFFQSVTDGEARYEDGFILVPDMRPPDDTVVYNN